MNNIIKSLYSKKTVSAIIEQKTVSANSYHLNLYGSYPLRGNEPDEASNVMSLLTLSILGDNQ